MQSVPAQFFFVVNLDRELLARRDIFCVFALFFCLFGLNDSFWGGDGL